MTAAEVGAPAQPLVERELLSAAATLHHLRRSGDTIADQVPRLYQEWYVRTVDLPPPPVGYPTDLSQVLRAVDATARNWEEGWVADRVHPDGRLIARRGREVRMADRCDHVSVTTPGLLPRAGDPVLLAGRRDRVDPDGHWWRTAGHGWRFTRTVPDLVRVYWNTDLAALPVLVRHLTDLLVHTDEPWMLKCATDPAVHARLDATVLYVTTPTVERIAGDIDAIAADVASGLLEGTPPLTLPIAPGVAVAFDPPPGESFGEHRCRLICESDPDGGASPDAQVAAIRHRYAAEGIDVSRPHAHGSDGRLPWER